MTALLGSRIRLSRAVPASLFVLALSAFGGCSEPTPATPRAVFDSTLGGGAGQTSSCQINSQTWFAIGNFGNPDKGVPSKPIESGETEGQGQVTVDCKVAPEGDGFRVVAEVSTDGAPSNTGPIGATFSIEGVFTAEGTQENVTAIFYRSDFGSFKQTDCTVTYPEAALKETPVAAGRVWGEISCPNIELADQGRVCTGKAEFRFENCNQN